MQCSSFELRVGGQMHLDRSLTAMSLPSPEVDTITAVQITRPPAQHVALYTWHPCIDRLHCVRKFLDDLLPSVEFGLIVPRHVKIPSKVPL